MESYARRLFLLCCGVLWALPIAWFLSWTKVALGCWSRELQLNREQTGMLRAARLAYVSELDLIREERAAALSAAGQDRIEARCVVS